MWVKGKEKQPSYWRATFLGTNNIYITDPDVSDILDTDMIFFKVSNQHRRIFVLHRIRFQFNLHIIWLAWILMCLLPIWVRECLQGPVARASSPTPVTVLLHSTQCNTCVRECLQGRVARNSNNEQRPRSEEIRINCTFSESKIEGSVLYQNTFCKLRAWGTHNMVKAKLCDFPCHYILINKLNVKTHIFLAFY